jgi:hypothetical protein
MVIPAEAEIYSERLKKVVIARSEATCLHAEVLAFAEATMSKQALRHAGAAIP